MSIMRYGDTAHGFMADKHGHQPYDTITTFLMLYDRKPTRDFPLFFISTV